MSVAGSQIIIHGDQVDAVARQCIEVGGQRGHQGLTLPGAHLCNLALMQHHTADQLHIEVPQPEHPVARFAHHGKSLGQQCVDSLSICQALPELVRPGSQLGIIQCLHVIGHGIDLLDHLAHTLQFTRIACTKNAFESFTDHWVSPSVQ